MKNVRLVILAGLLGLSVFSLASCSKKEKLYVYNWTYYTPDSVIKKFEAEYGVKVYYDSFASNEEMFAKLKAGGSGYDITFPSADYVSIMMREGMLEKVDHHQLANLGNIDPIVLEKTRFDPNMEYSVPYYFGAAGIAVNKKKVANYPRNWSIFSQPDLKGKMTMLDDMREVMGDALVSLGYSVNSTNPAEIDAAKDLVIKSWKPNLTKFDAEAFGKGFASGEFWVVQGYAEVVYEEIAEGQWADVDFFIPEEGGPAYIDYMVLLKGGRNPGLAHKFIDFIHRPDNYAEFCDFFGFPATANIPARQLLKKTPLYQAEELIHTELKEDLGEELERYNRAWQAIRIGE